MGSALIQTPTSVAAMHDVICNRDSREMREVANESIQLVVTSPPYNVGKGYDIHKDAMTWRKYQRFLSAQWREDKRVLVEGGRLAIVVADIGRSPHIPLHCYITMQLLNLGLLPRGTII